MKITDQAEITKLLAGYTPSKDGAQPTSRCLPGLYASENQQEWDCQITLADGRKATIFWIFENSDCTSEDADYPWSQCPEMIELAD